MQKAVDGSRKHVGEDHPDTLRRVEDLTRIVGTSIPPLRNSSDVRQKRKKPTRDVSFRFRICASISLLM
jgi:hypothetical protein